jgi:predicted signal transduction protein with EAL and GGDEF domain
MSFALYLAGFIILIAGLAWAATLMKVPSVWIGVGVVILIGLGILMGVTHTRRKDPPS